MIVDGTAQDDTIGIGAIEAVSAGLATSETVLRAAEMDVTGGIASGTIVDGGRLSVYAAGGDGVTEGTVLSSGSRELVSDGGRDHGATILSGAVEVISAVDKTAEAFGSLISNGGLEVVRESNAVADGATVFGGGTLSVTQGGRVLGGLILDGGLAIISGTASSGQTIWFGESGTLELANLHDFGAAISGLSASAQKVDLDGFAFSTSETVDWTQSGTSGTLKVTDGANVAKLTLIGSYATSDFNLADDGHGGTFVFDPQPSPAITRLTHAVAGLPGGRSGAGIAVVHNGGSVTDCQPLIGAISSR